MEGFRSDEWSDHDQICQFGWLGLKSSQLVTCMERTSTCPRWNQTHSQRKVSSTPCCGCLPKNTTSLGCQSGLPSKGPGVVGGPGGLAMGWQSVLVVYGSCLGDSYRSSSLPTTHFITPLDSSAPRVQSIVSPSDSPHPGEARRARCSSSPVLLQLIAVVQGGEGGVQKLVIGPQQPGLERDLLRSED